MVKLRRASKNRLIGRFLKSAWVFPSLVGLVFVVFVAFKISGTSEGMYNRTIYGKHAHDPSLIAGIPKSVRADEWQDTTQMIVAQSQNGYKKFNPNMLSGRDLALEVEVPYKDWSAVFRPHTWGFFLLGLERGFAFKWWLPMVLLLVSLYFFVLRLLPGKRLAASLISTGFGLSPFLLWWYQTSALGTIAYGLLAILLVQRLLNDEPIPFVKNRLLGRGLYAAGLAFVLSCFALLLYPPFQIPVAIVVAAYCAGLVGQKLFSDKDKLRQLLPAFAAIGAAMIFTALVGVAFIKGNEAPIHALSKSLYPGQRVTHSGDLSWLYLTNGYLMPLQEQGVKLFRNLSESSNFLLFLPFLLLPGYILMGYDYIKKRKFDWPLLFIQLCGTMFLLRAFVHFGDPFYKLLLLNKVPNVRMLIGIGFIGIVQMIYVMKKIEDVEWKGVVNRNLLAGITSAISLATLAATSLYVHHRHPKVFSNTHLMIIGGVWFCAIIYLVLARRATLAAAAYFGLAVMSGFYVLPLYRGLGFIDNSQLIRSMQKVSPPGSTWVTLDDISYENFGLLAGRQSLSGIQIYPDNSFWSQVAGNQYESVYNREGHVMFMTSGLHQDIYKVKSNLFYVRFYCSDFITKHVNYALATHPINYSCTKLVSTVSYPKQNFYLYQVTN